MTNHAGYTKGRKEAAESLTERKKYQESKSIIFSFCLSFLVFLSVLFGCFCCTERSKSFFGNQCITIVSYSLCILMQKDTCEVLDS